MERPDTNRTRLPAAALVACGALVLAGCATPPRARVETPSGEVRAASEELAREVADHCAWAEGEVRARVPGLRIGGVDVWVQERVSAGLWSAVHMRRGEYAAFTLSSPEFARPRIHVSPEGYRESLCHELVHALLDDGWEPLPAILEEGLCTVVSVGAREATDTAVEYLLMASCGRELALEHRVDPSDLELHSLVALTESLDLDDHGAEYQRFAYGVGYFLARRIVERAGIAGLRALCLRAGEQGLELVPADWILTAAGLERESDLAAAAGEELDRALFADFLRMDALAALLADRPAGATVRDITLTYSHPWLEGEEIVRPLEDLPGFEAWVAEHPELLEPTP